MRRSSLHLLRLALVAALPGCPLSKDDTAAEGARCLDGESILLEDGSPSGFERCADGAVNRVSAETFDPTIDLEGCRGDEESRSCETDADCTNGPHGACITGNAYAYEYYAPYTYCGCVYACASDGDCAEGEACVPSEVSGIGYATCQDATCSTDADCETGECGYSEFDDGCGPLRSLDCRTADDTCHTDSDCADGEGCWPDGSGSSWECDAPGCAIGRPLLVDGEARVAPPAARADWSDAPDVPVPLDPSLRGALAAHWAHVAAFEHASVGSFARFTLQLLALGAPPELVADAQAAAADEVRHATLAYGLASRYGGAPVGPGSLPLLDAAPALDARSVMQALVDEACIGETLGAAELLAAADTCVDSRLAEALRRAGEDEARHAALAWRTLRWLLARHPELREETEAALAARVAAAETLLSPSPDAPDYGVPGIAARRATHRAALAALVPACIDTCVGRVAA